jgi:hypothetical protein
MSIYSCIYPSGYTLSSEENTKYGSNKFTSLAAWNTAMVDDYSSEELVCEILGGDSNNTYLYNCLFTNLSTTYNNINHIYNNCVFFNNSDDINEDTYSTFNYCASDDTLPNATGCVDISPAGDGGESMSWNRCFYDYVNGIYRVRDSNSYLYDAGSITGSKSTDIQGTTRPQRVNPCIGPFEYITHFPGGGAFNPFSLIFDY